MPEPTSPQVTIVDRSFGPDELIRLVGAGHSPMALTGADDGGRIIALLLAGHTLAQGATTQCKCGCGAIDQRADRAQLLSPVLVDMELAALVIAHLREGGLDAGWDADTFRERIRQERKQIRARAEGQLVTAEDAAVQSWRRFLANAMAGGAGGTRVVPVGVPFRPDAGPNGTPAAPAPAPGKPCA